MNKTAFIFATLIGFCFLSFSQKDIIITVGDENTLVEEFKYVYEKNHSKDHDRYSQKSLDDYKELYINYRLKVIEAESRKLDSTPAFEAELRGYEKQLAKPYLTDDSFSEKLALEAYNRSKTAVRASHILIKVDETASAEDTLYAYKRINAIRDTILKGAKFADVARLLSQDPSAQRPTGQPGSGGDLGYFSALRMVYEFENVAYSTPVNEVSEPFRTNFGYHILKVTDKKSFDYKAQVSHIMIKAPNKLDHTDSIKKKEEIDYVYELLKNDGNWNEICLKYSNDNNTKNNGGQLPEFTIGGSLGVPNFELTAYSLKEPGEISQPIKTSFGWHIIKLDKKVSFQPFEDVKKDYLDKIKRDARSQKDQDALVKKLKTEYKFKESKNLNSYLKGIEDEKILSHNWSIKDHQENLDTDLFSINKKSYTLYDFSKYLESNQKQIKKGSKDYMITKGYESFVNKSIIEHKENELKETNFGYSMLIKEFHDGILIYDLMKAEVWDKANSDTVGLKAYYEAHKEEYVKEDYIACWVFKTKDLSLLPKIKKDLSLNYTSDSVLNKYNTNKNKVAVSFEEKDVVLNSSPLADALDWNLDSQIEIHEILGEDLVVKKLSIHKHEYYTLKEIRGKVVAGYQKQLEEEFLKELKEKYSVTINEKKYQELVRY